MWYPNIGPDDNPLYLAIADRLADDVASGKLSAGTRLPTHRQLAVKVGVTVGTVTRAYAEAIRRGLIRGEVGRGTFVRGREDGAYRMVHSDQADPDLLDLSLNFPPVACRDTEAVALSAALRELAARQDLGSLLAYQPTAGAHRHRDAGARWLQALGLDATPARTVVTSGAHNAMTVILGSTCKAGDLVLTENLTFPGIKSLAAMLSLRLQGIAMDEHGLRPDAFEAACRTGAPRALYCVPTIQNPTTSVMPPQRRAEIAAIARQHGVTIIEDDIHAPLMTDPPQPIAALVPERSYYISSLSKCLAPGLRIAYVHVPDARAVESLAATILTTTGLASPLLAEIAGLWGEDGTARTLVQARRDEAAARHAIAREALDGLEMAAHPSGFHVWLHVPEPWRSDELVAHARQQGIALTPPSAFVVGRREAPHAVRVCLGAAPGRDRLRAGLRRLADLLRSAPTPIASMV